MTTPRTGTKVGFMPTRLPAGAARARLLRLAQRGAEVYHKHRAPTAALIADTAAAALVELAIAEARLAGAEKSLAAAQVRIDDLKRKLREETFEDPTVTREVSERTLIRLASSAE